MSIFSIDIAVFFFAGLYVALSPCLFPLMPLTIFRIMNKGVVNSQGETITPPRSMVLKWVLILVSGIFVTFFVIAFIGSYIWTELVLRLNSLYRPLSLIMGIILIVMGLFIIFPQLSEMTFARIPIPQEISQSMVREEYSGFDLFIMGLGYSIIAFPCASPIFVFTFFNPQYLNNPLTVLIGMIFFGIGLFIPYLILVFVTAEARVKVARTLAENFRKIELILGILIILFGFIFLLVGLGIILTFPTFF